MEAAVRNPRLGACLDAAAAAIFIDLGLCCVMRGDAASLIAVTKGVLAPQP